MRFDKLPYVDLTKPWWNMNAGEYFRIDDKLYFMTGDYVLYEKQRLPAMMVNLSMAEDYEIEDLYAAVDEGRWTVDLMNTYAALVKDDLDGDGTMDQNNLLPARETRGHAQIQREMTCLPDRFRPGRFYI